RKGPEHVGLCDVAASARAHRYVGSAAVPAAQVEDAIVVRRDWDREAVGLAGLLEQRAGLRVVRVYSRRGVDHELVARGACDHDGRGVGDGALRALRPPDLLARQLVDREEVRRRLVVAEQDQEVAVVRGRAAMAPVDLERREVLREVALPERLALRVEGHELAVAEPGAHAAAAGAGARARADALLVDWGDVALRPQPLPARAWAGRVREDVHE